MSKSTTVFWHLGFPKTATTALQTHVFPNLNEINYLGWYYLLDRAEKNRRNNLIVKLRDLATWSAAIEKAYPKDYFPNMISEIYPCACFENMDLLISDEGLISAGLVPQMKGGQVKFRNVLEGIELTKNLCRSAGYDAKYILVLREQAELVESVFAEAYAKLNAYLGIKDPAEYLNIISSTYRSGEPGALLQYDQLIGRIAAIVGKDNLLVLPYEMLKDNLDGFASSLCRFMEVDSRHTFENIRHAKENVRSGKGGRLVAQAPMSTRIKERFIGDVSFRGLGRLTSFLDRMFKKKIKIDDDRKKRFREVFKESNANLIVRYPDFQAYSYYSGVPADFSAVRLRNSKDNPRSI